MKGPFTIELTYASVKEALEEYLNRHLMADHRVTVSSWEVPFANVSNTDRKTNVACLPKSLPEVPKPAPVMKEDVLEQPMNYSVPPRILNDE